MAVKGPILVHDSTGSSGLGSLTLNNNPGLGRRGLADAVAEGHVANGDQVPYYIANSTQSGPALVFEHGLGTISSSGATLSRDTIYQSSTGTTKVDLPAGPQYDVVIGVGLAGLALAANNGSEFTAATFATNLGLPRLSAANVFTNIQRVSGSAGAFLEFLNTTAARTWDLRTTSGGAFRLTDATAAVVALEFPGTGSGNITFGSSYSLLHGTNKVDAFPSGTKLLFGAAPPVGWTRVNVTGDRFTRLAGAADTPGAQGAATVSGLTATTTVNAASLTEAQLAAHTHGLTVVSGGGGGNTGLLRVSDGFTIVSGITTSSSGSGGTHTHTASTSINSGSATVIPAYEIWVKATKN